MSRLEKERNVVKREERKEILQYKQNPTSKVTEQNSNPTNVERWTAAQKSPFAERKKK